MSLRKRLKKKYMCRLNHTRHLLSAQNQFTVKGLCDLLYTLTVKYDLSGKVGINHQHTLFFIIFFFFFMLLVQINNI